MVYNGYVEVNCAYRCGEMGDLSYRSIKYRVYPTKEQAELFTKTFGCCRKIYNLMLEDCIKGYRETGEFKYKTPAKYKEEYPYLKEVDSTALAYKYMDLRKAFESHFSKRRKKNTGFPKFKSEKHSRKSYTAYNHIRTIAIEGNGIRLPKTGVVKAAIHRLPESGWTIKSATVSQDPDEKYYVSVNFEFAKPICNHGIDRSNAIGLDYASSGLYVDSNGNRGTDHKFFCENQVKLAKEQRKLARKIGNKKGSKKSNNYLKQLRKVNKVRKHIVNQRLDNLHKLSTEIANQYDIVCVESLSMKAIGRGFRNGKATYDNGYRMFLDLLDYKLVERGKHLIKVDRMFPSSQLCCECGLKHPEMKNIANRTMKCRCGNHMDRDINAARNILQEGLRIYDGEYRIA